MNKMNKRQKKLNTQMLYEKYINEANALSNEWRTTVALVNEAKSIEEAELLLKIATLKREALELAGKKISSASLAHFVATGEHLK